MHSFIWPMMTRVGKAPPPPPRFDHLTNAFSTPVAVSRVKRARTEATSPGASPSKVRELTAVRSSPTPEAIEEQVDEVIDIQWHPGLDTDEPMQSDEEEVDQKAEVGPYTLLRRR